MFIIVIAQMYSQGGEEDDEIVSDFKGIRRGAGEIW